MAAVIQRPLRGSRVSTFYPVKNLPSLSSLDSAFQLQEYISLLIRLDVHDVDAIISFPGTSEKDKKQAADKEKEESKDDGAKEGDKDAEKAKNEVTVDEGCWIYEQLRRLAQDLSHPLITTLQQECTRASCPEMKAGEWLYLCVAHGNDGAMEQCCAIDYILHTVDSATALLNSPRTFPSRLSIPQTSHRHFASLARRLGRIFAHAYFHHREAFEQAEAESSLYARFLALTDKFNLVPAEFLVIPPHNFANDDAGAGPNREREPSLYDYNDPGRAAYHAATMQAQQGSADRFHAAQGYRQHEYHGMEDQPRHPSSVPSLVESSGGGASTNGGIGETPSATRSRFGRSRTDTMVFNDSEASAIADELAANARAGQLEPESLESSSKTQSEMELEKAPEHEEEDEEDEEEGDLEGETQFEISLSPEEEINGTYGEFTGIPAHQVEKKDAQPSDVAPTSQLSSTVPVPQHVAEEPPAQAQEKQLHATEIDKAEEPAVVEPVVDVHEQKKTEVKSSEPAKSEVAPEKVAESSTSEPVTAPAPTPASAPAPPSVPEEQTLSGEVKSETSAPDAPLATPVHPVEESAPSVKEDVVEADVPPATETTPPSSESKVGAEVLASSSENQASAVEPPSVVTTPATTAVAEGTDAAVVLTPAPAEEAATSEDITPEEIQAIEEATVGDVEPSAWPGPQTEKSDKESKPEAENKTQASLPTVPEPDSATAASAAAAADGKEDQAVSASH